MGNGLKRAAWNGLESLRPALRKYLARRCVDEHEVEDVIQEAFLRAARYRGKLEQTSQLRAWTLRIASNLLSDRLARRLRWNAISVEGELLEPEAEPETVHEAQELDFDGWCLERASALDHLQAALEELREPDRALLRSFYAGSGSSREVAQECSIEPHLVKVRLFRARRRLQSALRRRLALHVHRSEVQP